MALEAVFGSPLPAVKIVGDEYVLRSFRPDDVAVVEEASRDDLIPSITTVPSTFTAEAGLAYVDRQNDRRASGEGWSLTIAERSTDLAIGQIGLWISHIHDGRAEIGYWVAASERGHGAASKSVQLLSEWAFENLDVDRLNLYIEPWNVASIKSAQRAGFIQEAVLRGWERVDGIPKDMLSLVRFRPGLWDDAADPTEAESA